MTMALVRFYSSGFRQGAEASAHQTFSSSESESNILTHVTYA